MISNDISPNSGWQFSHSLAEDVETVAFSPFSQSFNLLAYGTSQRVGVLLRPASTEREDFVEIASLHTGSAALAIAWGQRSLVSDSSCVVSLAAACADNVVRVFNTATSSTSEQVSDQAYVPLKGHSEKVNDVAFLADSLLATCSDDCSCWIWDVEVGDTTNILRLPGAAVSVRGNPNVPSQVLVAEVGGTVKLFDLRKAGPAMTLYSHNQPLTDMDWSPVDPHIIGAVCGDRWYVWNTHKGSIADSSPAHADGAQRIRFSHNNASVFATASSSSAVSLWNVAHPRAPHTRQQTTAVRGISWHGSTPMVVIGGQRCLHFWINHLER